jgi:hypothetical protein
MSTYEDAGGDVLAQVRDLWARLDPVPAGLTDEVKYALSVKLLEAEVAELTRMPALASRGELGELTRNMSFTGSRLSLMATVTDEGEELRIDCWVTIPGAEIELHAPGLVQTETADQDGRVVFTGVAPGSVHFIVWPEPSRTERPIITPTIDL